jgi:S-adenosylmethionine synthetase
MWFDYELLVWKTFKYKKENMSYLFTSESVSEGHPDKVADAISDAVLDIVMSKQDSALRCACETLVTTNRVVVAGEYKGILHAEEVDSAVRRVVKDIGYEQSGFDWNTLEITNLLHGQSADIALGTDTFGAGDQGLMFGYACNETEVHMPSAIYWSHRIVETLTKVRKSLALAWLGPDAKSQVTFEYNDDGTPKRIAKVVCSTQHHESVGIDQVRMSVESVIRSILPEKYVDNQTEFYINPTGRFVIGGPDGDTGLTGRKIIVDTYGGYSPHGGGAFSGKDPTKVDRSAAYLTRWIAKNIVASGRADWATVQISYAIGLAQPMSFYVETADAAQGRELTKWIQDNVDLTPMGIIKRFDLFRPIYGSTTNYGHFGKDYLPWEKVDLF